MYFSFVIPVVGGWLAVALLYSRKECFSNQNTGWRDSSHVKDAILAAKGEDQEILRKLSEAIKVSAQSWHQSLSLILHWTKHVTLPNLIRMEIEICSHSKKWQLDAVVIYFLNQNNVESERCFLIVFLPIQFFPFIPSSTWKWKCFLKTKPGQQV